MHIAIVVFFVGFFVLGIGAFLVLAIWGAITRHRDHRSPQERWEDEHGDEDLDAPKLYGGPSWTGPGPGF